jgi:RNA polymerase sigma-70 factor, ECF subfamily
VEVCADPIYRYLYRRLAPHYDVVEDTAQEVFLEALDSLSTFRGSSSLVTWILAIARHKVQDFYRRQLRNAESPDEEARDLEALEETVSRHLERARIQSTLERMPETYRIVLLWRYWEDRSTAEIAAVCGKTEKAVERLLARAREQFRRCYGE